MNQMDITVASDVNTEGLDLIDHDTRFDILENKVTLAVPGGNPKSIQSFDDLASHLQAGDILMAMGNSDVPVGQYPEDLAYYNLDETLASAGTITYATNVKEVTSQVSAGSANCGVIYQTDAYSAGLAVVDSATKDMCGRVVCPAAAIKAAPHPEVPAPSWTSSRATRPPRTSPRSALPRWPTPRELTKGQSLCQLLQLIH